MSIRTVTSGGVTYQVEPAAPPAAMAHSERAVLRLRIVDELTGLGIGAGATILTEDPGLNPRVSADGVLGLTGNPARRFTDLAAAPVDIDAEVSAPGFLPRRVSAQLGPINTGTGAPADFPDHFRSLDLGNTTLHRTPVAISGRVMRETGASRVALAGVSVRVTGIWRAEPGPDDDPGLLVEAPEILSLSPGLYRDRPGATNTLVARAVNVAAQTKRLLRNADAGSETVRLSDRVGLVVGELLALDAGSDETRELIEIAAIDGGLLADEPATVRLAYPLARARRTGDVAAPAAPAPGAVVPAALVRDGLNHDATAHLDAIPAALGTVGTVEIAGDGVTEYQTAARFGAVTGPDGTYRFPGLSRVARLTVEADRADFLQPIVQTIAPAFGATTQTLDFLHRP